MYTVDAKGTLVNLIIYFQKSSATVYKCKQGRQILAPNSVCSARTLKFLLNQALYVHSGFKLI